MGLCKCPSRQVTNQFCFEHRVNVCEKCMIVSHRKCIVQSYLQWLNDSDYSSLCTLCGNSLEENDCIRLICYHVFHWECLNIRQQSLPTNTAMFTCPTCNESIFPHHNLVSPVADALRAKLGQVNWGRMELGLPLLTDEQNDGKSQKMKNYINPDKIDNLFSKSLTQNRNNIVNAFKSNTIVNIDTGFGQSSSLSTEFMSSSRKPAPGKELMGIKETDRDDNKYKRRTISEVFSRYSRRFLSSTSKPPWKRKWFLVIGGILLFIIVVYLMALFGRREGNFNEFENEDV